LAWLTRTLFITSCMVSLAGVASSAERPSGCFARTYDAAHMRGHPKQQVRRLWIEIKDSPYDAGKTIFGMNLWLRGKPQIWRAGGVCEPDGQGWTCQPDTDGASKLLVAFRSGQLRLINPGMLKIEDDETGPDLNDVHLRGPGDFSFLLRQGPGSVCKDRSS
jgi:hypothetical protein